MKSKIWLRNFAQNCLVQKSYEACLFRGSAPKALKKSATPKVLHHIWWRTFRVADLWPASSAALLNKQVL
jgi:hypothetical protein